MDQHFKDLLEASSLGTPAARRIRASTPEQVVDDVLRRRVKAPPAARSPSLAAVDDRMTGDTGTGPRGSRRLARVVVAAVAAAAMVAGLVIVRTTGDTYAWPPLPVTKRVSLVEFSRDQSQLSNYAEDLLRSWQQTISKHWPESSFTIVGYTAAFDPAAGNHKLSQERVNAVATFLKALGVSQAHILAQVYRAPELFEEVPNGVVVVISPPTSGTISDPLSDGPTAAQIRAWPVTGTR